MFRPFSPQSDWPLLQLTSKSPQAVLDFQLPIALAGDRNPQHRPSKKGKNSPANPKPFCRNEVIA